MRLFLAVLSLVFAASVQAAAPGWITSCAFSHSNNDDPIVYPGQPGQAHLHDFTGARTTDAFSTFSSLLAGGTSCAMPDDKSAYWVPRMYIHNGAVSLPPRGSGAKNALFYYRKKGTSGAVTPFPPGLKIIVGNANAQSPAQNTDLAAGRIIFKCGPGSGTDLPAPPGQCGSGLMVVSLTFPNCWNGRDLDSPDHKSHMKYPPCGSTHPIVLPLGVVEFAGEDGERHPYYTVHQDLFQAWDPIGLKFFIDTCMNQNRDCGTNPQR